MAQLGDLVLSQVVENLAAHAGAVDQRERRQTDIVHAVFAVHQRRDGQGRARRALQTLAQVADRNGHRIERRALVLDDLRAGLLDELLDRKSTRLNSSHLEQSRMPSSA